jgi:hypothetical protein
MIVATYTVNAAGFSGTASFEVNGTSCGYTFTATQN